MRVIRVLVYEGPAEAIDRTMKQNQVKGFVQAGDLAIHESLIGYAYPLEEGEKPECKRCHGRGYVGANSLDMLREPCDECGGSGDVPTEAHEFEASPVDENCLRCGLTFGDGLHI